MALDDLTVIFLTVNKVPKEWAEYQKKVLSDAIGDTPIITISKEPIDWGMNLIQDGPINASNIYRQMLRGAKLAKTPYIAVAEDDALYPDEHFTSFRPKLDEFAYNMCRWAIFTWGTPTYFWRKRISNLTLIAPRELAIKSLEERFAKHPDGGPEYAVGELGKARVQRRLELPYYKYVEFYTTIPVINFNHDYSIDPMEKSHRKRMAKLRSFDIPHWGKADEIVKHFV